MKSAEEYISAKAKLDAYLVSHRLRHTQERYILLQALCEMEQPFIAGALVEVARSQHISQATVYNSIALFVSAQILHCVGREYGRAGAKYELITDGTIHMELICKRCGRVSRFRDVAIENLVRARRYSNFNLQHYSFYVYGECKTCKRKPKTI